MLGDVACADVLARGERGHFKCGVTYPDEEGVVGFEMTSACGDLVLLTED